jgi:hypothetical protein
MEVREMDEQERQRRFEIGNDELTNALARVWVRCGDAPPTASTLASSATGAAFAKSCAAFVQNWLDASLRSDHAVDPGLARTLEERVRRARADLELRGGGERALDGRGDGR